MNTTDYQQHLRIVTENGCVKVYDEMSIYKFGVYVLEVHGPQAYSMEHNGRIPENLLVTRRVVNKDGTEKDQKFVQVTAAIEYFKVEEAKKAAKSSKYIASHPEMFAEAFILMLEADNKKLGKQVRKWWTDRNAPTPESK